MKITASNPELLRELHTRLKNANVNMIVIEQPSNEKEKLTLSEFLQLILEYPEESRQIAELVIDELLSLHRLEHIYVEQKDGKKIPYAEYKEMSLEKKSELIF